MRGENDSMTQQEELKRAVLEFQDCFTALRILKDGLMFASVAMVPLDVDMDLIIEAANNVKWAARLVKLNLMEAKEESRTQTDVEIMAGNDKPDCPVCIELNKAYNQLPPRIWACHACDKVHGSANV